MNVRYRRLWEIAKRRARITAIEYFDPFVYCVKLVARGYRALKKMFKRQ